MLSDAVCNMSRTSKFRTLAVVAGTLLKLGSFSNGICCFFIYNHVIHYTSTHISTCKPLAEWLWIVFRAFSMLMSFSANWERERN